MTQDEINKILRKRKPSGRDIAKLEIHNQVENHKKGEKHPIFGGELVPGEKIQKLKEKIIDNQNEINDYVYTLEVNKYMFKAYLHTRLAFKDIAKQLLKRNEAIRLLLLDATYKEAKDAMTNDAEVTLKNVLDSIVRKVNGIDATLDDINIQYIGAYRLILLWNEMIRMIADERKIPDLLFYVYSDTWKDEYIEAIEQQNQLIKLLADKLEPATVQKFIHFGDTSGILETPEVKKRLREARSTIYNEEMDVYDVGLELFYDDNYQLT